MNSVKISEKIGSEIRLSKAALLDGSHSDEIRGLLEERGVLVFRQLNLNDEEQAAFARTIGTIAKAKDSGADVYKISRDAEKNATANYMIGTFFWHIDGTADDIPGYASILTGRKIPENGAVTEYANTYAAYADLPDQEKDELAHLQVVHSIENLMRCANPEPSYAELQGWQSLEPKTHPLVWTHRSGRKSLVLGSSASYVIGMDYHKASALLCRLRDWATQPQFVYRHEWQVGDMVMWDNTGTMHRAMPYSADSGRQLHRVGLVGDEPIA
jgi:alpha-ketoglutarate-dependent taurine dioxygenase